MKKFASLLLAFAMTVGMLTGCGGDSGTSSTGEAPAQEVTVAISSTFATLDPALISTTHMAHVYGNMGSNFYRTDANGVLQYDLGENMEKSEDGLTYTFTIKEGLKWSDGEPLTAEHFVYGIKRAIGYGPDNAYTKKNLVNFIAGGSCQRGHGCCGHDQCRRYSSGRHHLPGNSEHSLPVLRAHLLGQCDFSHASRLRSGA